MLRHFYALIFRSDWSRCFVFFFKQKTAYEMRISDWSSDVCSSDLSPQPKSQNESNDTPPPADISWKGETPRPWPTGRAAADRALDALDRQSVVQGTRVSVRVDPGGRRTIKNKKQTTSITHTNLRTYLPTP